MAKQVYECPVHGQFEVEVRMCEDRPETAVCLAITAPGEFRRPEYCGQHSPWVPSAPAVHFGESWGPRA